MIESWKRVEGWPYEVSDQGRVRNLRTGHVLRPAVSTGGYFRVCLCDAPRKKACSVHRLELEAFCGPPPEGYQCNHKDGDKQNNRLENLEWVTPQENTRHAVAHGLFDPRGEANHKSVLTEPDVDAILRQLPGFDERVSWQLVVDLANEFDVTPATIYDIHVGRSWRHVQEERIAEHEANGESLRRTTLTQKDVGILLAALPDPGSTLPFVEAKGLAEEFGISSSYVYDIHAGRRWAGLQVERFSSPPESEGESDHGD